MCRKLFYLTLTLVLELVLTNVARATDPDLVGWWKFDEGSGSTAYDSAGSNDGTIYGATWTTGMFGGALDFDGSGDDYVDCGNDSSLSITDNLTICAWVKQAANDIGYVMLKNPSNDSYREYGMRCHGPQNMLYFYYRSTANEKDSEYWILINIDDNQWHHLAITVGYPDSELYVDGVSKGVKTLDGTLVAGTADLQIGRKNYYSYYTQDPDDYFDGSIDDVMVYNKELSSQEVQDVYTGINETPVITSVNASPSTISDTETSQLQVTANDPDSGPSALTYNWSVQSGEGTLNNYNIANPIYTPPDVSSNQTFTLTVDVSDGEDITSDTVNITITDTPNQAPVITSVNASPSTISDTETSQLQVTANDPDSGPSALTYNWSVQSGEGTLNNYNIANPIYTPPDVSSNQTFTLTVDVSDGEDITSSTVDITVTNTIIPNQAPVITSVTASPSTISDTETSQLQVTANDPDSGPSALTYNWSVQSGEGTLNNYNIANPIYTPPDVSSNQTFTLTVDVSDGEDITSSTVNITVTDTPNQAPVITSVNASPSTISDTETSQLQVTANDPDSGPSALTYNWTVQSGEGTLNNYNIANPIYTPPDVSSNQTFTLTVDVSDGEDITSSTVDITVTDAASPIPIGWWKFDEGTGSTAYDSEGSNDGEITGAIWTTGKIGGALDFDGSGDNVNCGNDSSLQTTSITVSLWAYIDTKSDSIITKGASRGATSTRDWDLYGDGTDLRFIVSNGSSYIVNIDGGGFPTLSAWHHIAATWDGTTGTNGAKLYVDGELFDSATATNTNNSNSYNVYIGGGVNSSYYFDGKIDDVRIYDYEISSQDVQDLYEESEVSPVGHWEFDDGTGLIATDSAGNNDGDIIDATWTTGTIGGALDFDGSDDYVALNSIAAPSSLPLTVSAWINVNDTSSSQRIVDAEGGNNYYGFWLQTTSSGEIELSFGDGSGTGTADRRTSASSLTVSNNQWYHVVGVIKGSTDMNIYIDGVNDTSLTYSGSGGAYSQGSASGYIGAVNAGGTFYYFNGKIDDARIYNYELSSQEVQDLYEESEVSPVSHWKFDGVTGPEATDSAGSNHGTITDASRITGLLGGALNFDGNGDYVNTGNDSSLLTSDGTVSAWVKTTTDSPGILWSAGDTNGKSLFYIALGNGATGTLTNELITILTGNSSSTTVNRIGYTTTTRSELFDGSWHHIAIVAGSDYDIYLDGVSKTVSVGYGNDNGMFTDTAGIDNTRIGDRNVNNLGEGVYFTGSIDDVRFYDQALSEQDVQDLYGGTPLPFSENFNDGNHDGWTLVDQGTENTPMSWSASTNVMVQSSNVHTLPGGTEIPKLGTYAYWSGGSSWTDYKTTLTIKSADNDAIGLMFRYQDQNNYYRFSWDQERNYRRLVKCVNGSFTQLAGDSVTYVTNQTYDLEVIADGDSLKVSIDDNQIFSVTDNTFSSGSIALYCWGNVGAYFDDISVTSISSSLVSHWKFDEVTGPEATDFAGNNDGTITDASRVTGLLGGALDFDGSGDYVDVGNNESLEIDITNSSVTISAWVYPKVITDYEPVFIADDYDGAYYGYMLMITPDGYVWLTYGDGTGAGESDRRTKTGTTSLQINTWYHVVGVIRGATDMSIFINGVDDGGTYSGNGGEVSYSSASASIGRVRFGTLDNEFNGSIDEVMIFERALTEGEVRLLPVLIKRGIPLP